MINYDPLFSTLRERKMFISDLRDHILSSKTITRINRNESVTLATIEKLCNELDVTIDKIVEVKPDK